VKRLAALTLLALSAAGCSRGGDGPASGAAPLRAEPARLEAAGLHNVFRLSDRLYSGSAPEGDAGFASLRALGVRTVLSVDGARPDAERARAHGLRYVHLPVGYDGVPPGQGLRIARAVRDLPGPVYVHCHHGRHRGPAAAAVALLSLDQTCPVADAVAWMRRAGTDPHYAGLYACVERLRRPSPADLDGAAADFPEAVDPPALAQAMVDIDERWGRLQEVRAAGWRAPPGHPDVDPPHEALQLTEQLREAARLPEVSRRPEAFRRRLAEAEEAALGLEAALRRGGDGTEAEKRYQAAAAACARCHGTFRDVPQGP
jgi:protein tyrosine phosphatase (PTP) superfamily phosphohydrolase (DUF442 family)